jgi:hypothetical protein
MPGPGRRFKFMFKCMFMFKDTLARWDGGKGYGST